MGTKRTPRTGWVRARNKTYWHFVEVAGKGPHVSACGREFLPGRGLRADGRFRYPSDCSECWRVRKASGTPLPPLKEYS